MFSTYYLKAYLLTYLIISFPKHQISLRTFPQRKIQKKDDFVHFLRRNNKKYNNKTFRKNISEKNVLLSEKYYLMNYIEVSFDCNPNNEIIREVLSAQLADAGFDSFVDSEQGIVAYIQEKLFDTSNIDQIIRDFPLEAGISYTHTLIPDKNWNEEWEKNYFEPLVIDNRCVIKSTFHQYQKELEYNILIDPKMAFGTGHHQTTELMIREILKEDFSDKTVLDMGCGTAILAILASMRGADPILAIDIDEWAYDNAKENLDLNHISNIEVQIGGAELLEPQKPTFDIVLANINRNILLQDINKYASVLNNEGILFMSGFYTEDIPAITEECSKYKLTFSHSDSKDNWAVVKFIKQI